METDLTDASRNVGFEGFLNNTSSLAFRKTWLFGLYMTVAAEVSRSRACTDGVWGFLVGVEDNRGFEVVEADKCSRDGVGRRRGLFMACLGDCCRFSLEAAGRSVELGTGSLESLDGRGMREGFGWFAG